MKPAGFLAIIAALFSHAVAAYAEASPHIGDTYEITRTKDSAQHGSNGSSGSTHDKDVLVERVIGLRMDGLELEYDLPKTASADERSGNWQFPARVFKLFVGSAQLLNASEMAERVDGWLKRARMTRTACGHWIFTWNAFRVECDPQSVVDSLKSFDLGPSSLQDGALYQDAEVLQPGKLAKTAGQQGVAIFAAEMPVDPEPVRRARAESDVAIGEIMKKPITLEGALNKRAMEVVSGTISVAFEADSAGNVRRRTKVTNLEIKGPDGKLDTETTTETLERRLISTARP